MFKGLIRAGLIVGSLFHVAPALAQVVITQAKALRGNVTAGDDPGFPVTLTVQGSYRLGSNLFPGDDRDGILVAANDVTIDLNGFLISGGSAARPETNAERGIVGLADRLTVKNGMINAMRVSGIHFPDRHYLIVENMRIINNADGVVNDNGDFARVQSSTVATNGGAGIICGDFCQIDRNNISGNGDDGIFCLKACHVEANVVSGNGKKFDFNVHILDSGTVLGNTITLGGGIGIFGPSKVGVGNNTVFDNSEGDIAGNPTPLNPNACPSRYIAC